MTRRALLKRFGLLARAGKDGGLLITCMLFVYVVVKIRVTMTLINKHKGNLRMFYTVLLSADNTVML